MRWTEDQIKACILHPNAEVRLMALDFFVGAYSHDPSLMPLVIEATEKYGRDDCAVLVCFSSPLRQNSQTIDWLVRELNSGGAESQSHRVGNQDQEDDEDYDDEDDEDEVLQEYSEGIELCLCHADLDLVAARQSEIVDSGNLSSERSRMLKQRLSLRNCDQATAWRLLDEFCEARKDQTDPEVDDVNQAECIVEALVRQPDLNRDKVMAMLAETVSDENDQMMWRETLAVKLAGQARITAAIPLLLEKMHEENDTLISHCTTALGHIGTPEVLTAAAAEFADAHFDFKRECVDLFKSQHSELALRYCAEFLEDEEDEEIRILLAYVMAGRFDTAGIKGAANVIREVGVTWDTADLVDQVLTACRAMEYTLPELDTWHAQLEILLSDFDEDEYDDDSGDFSEDEDLWDDDPNEEDVVSGGSLGNDSLLGSNLVPPRLMEHLYQRPDDQSELLNAPLGHKQKIGRNDPCPCGSGKKFKACCLKK